MNQNLLDTLPDRHRPAFGELVDRLQRLLRGNLIGISVYGGWLSEDPSLDGELATSLVTVREDDLGGLTNLADDGVRYADKGLRAPYFMSEDYVQTSIDTFAVEFLEIQQTGRLLHGEDLFAGLAIKRSCVRAQCERMLKAELMYLRQGLLRSDYFSTMKAIVRPCVLRLLPVLNGVLFLHGATCERYVAESLISQSVTLSGVALPTLRRFVSNAPDRVSLEFYKQVYGEIGALADWVDGLTVADDA